MSKERVPEMIDMLGLSHKDFLTPIMDMVKDLKEKMDIMSKQMRTFSREMNYLVKIEILELKNLYQDIKRKDL